ncbi:hypothetical protein [Tenacibaculum agarivorans]|uniref:hypothetical protein n=1 Tax=Tenacibaculum agarivorans TaxID=1908389 RepID=UPI00094B9309|nr:hypothetical protein [Tenacibaculum agarivorans]
MKLYCKKCKYLLVEGLIKAKSSEVIYTDEISLIPKGKYLINNDVWNFEDLQITYLINIKSIKLKDHYDYKKMQGCCGPSGLDGLNQLCPTCNEEIGVLIADCFTPHFIGIEKNKVSEDPLW